MSVDLSVIAVDQEHPIAMGNCNLEEADTRMVVHLMNALEYGLNCIVVRTVDTDVIVVLICEFHAIHKVFPEKQTFGLFLELAKFITTSTL